jgi:hypothetical protein
MATRFMITGRNDRFGRWGIAGRKSMEGYRLPLGRRERLSAMPLPHLSNRGPSSIRVAIAVIVGLLVATAFPPLGGTASAEPGPPGAPTGVVAALVDGVVQVSWSAPEDDGGAPLTGYSVTAEPGGLVATTTGATSTNINNFTYGTAYTFAVAATNGHGTGPVSEPSASFTPRTVPGAPTTLTAVGADGAATVSWTPPQGNGGSPIERYTVTAHPGGATATTQGAATATVTGLSNGTAYTFNVTATNAVGTGPTSVPSAAVTPLAVPGAPTNVVAAPAPGSATVSWTAPTNDGGSPITGYTVTSSPGGVVVSTSGSTSAMVTGLDNGTAYTFTVVATNAVGIGAASIPSAAQMPATVPVAVTAVTAVAGDGSAVVGWTPPATNGGSPVTTYAVTVSPGGSVVTSTASTATVTGLTNGSTYTFTVVASNAIGAGPVSAPSAAIVPASRPQPPTGLQALPGNGQAVITWAAPVSDPQAPVTGYQIIATTSGMTWTVAAPATATTVGPLTNGISTTFVVRSVNRIGSSPDSAPSPGVSPHQLDASVCVNHTIAWTGAALDGAWSNPNNWSPAQLPGVNDRLCLPPGSTPRISASTSIGSLVIHEGAVLEVSVAAASGFDIRGSTTNNGVIRVTAVGGFQLGCGVTLTNNGLIQVTATGGSPSSDTFTGTCGWPNTGRLYNGPTGTVESWAPSRTGINGWIVAESDGLVTARAGVLNWYSVIPGATGAPLDGVSNGRFASDGGTTRLFSVNAGPGTQFSNEVVVAGPLTGEVSLPGSVTLIVDGGSLNAQIAGPGWVLAKTGSIGGTISGNLRVEPTTDRAVSLGSLSVAPTGVVVLTRRAQVNGSVTNNGTMHVVGETGLYLSCGSLVTNGGLLQLDPGSAAGTTFTFGVNQTDYCMRWPGFYNAPSGRFESNTANTVTFAMTGTENDGIVVANAGLINWPGGSAGSTPPTDGVSAGSFGGGDGLTNIGGVVGGPGTSLGRNVMVVGSLGGTVTIPEGVTVVGCSFYDAINVALSGAGWLEMKCGGVVGTVIGNVRLAGGTIGGFGQVTTVTAGASLAFTKDGRFKGTVVNNATITIPETFKLDVEASLTNNGIIRVTGPQGMLLRCSTVIINNGLIEVAATGGSSSTFTAEYGSTCAAPAWEASVYNAPTGTIANFSPRSVSWPSPLENDGLMVAHAGVLSGGGASRPPGDGISTGRYHADGGGAVNIGSGVLSAATQYGDGVFITGYVTGTISLPENSTLTLGGGTLDADLTGPGWLTATGGFLSRVTGQVRVVGPVSTGSFYSYWSPVTIAAGGTVEVATGSLNIRPGASTNLGTVRILGTIRALHELQRDADQLRPAAGRIHGRAARDVYGRWPELLPVRGGEARPRQRAGRHLRKLGGIDPLHRLDRQRAQPRSHRRTSRHLALEGV